MFIDRFPNTQPLVDKQPQLVPLVEPMLCFDIEMYDTTIIRDAPIDTELVT